MKVLVSGAGIAGLTLALWLNRGGHAVELVERASEARDAGYMIDFFGSGYDVAEALGLLPELERIHVPIPRLAFVGSDGAERFSVAYPEIRKLFDDRHFNFMRGALEEVLLGHVTGVARIRYGTTIEALEPAGDAVAARLDDGTRGSYDLVVGADGVHSGVRGLAFGPEERFARDLGLRTAAFVLGESPPGLARRDAFVTLTVPDRQVGVYPIGDGRLATFFVWRGSETVEGRSDGEARAVLRAAFGDLGWIVPTLLARCPAKGLYLDVVEQIEMPAWSAGRVSLVGDACGCVSLLAGQGASLAMTGAWALARALVDHREPLAALAAYERRMRPAIADKQAAGRGMARWFVPTGRTRLFLRDLVLRLAARPVGRSLVKRAVAPAPVVPRREIGAVLSRPA